MGLVYTVITSIKGRHQQLLFYFITQFWEWLLTESRVLPVLSVKVFRKCKGFKKSQFYIYKISNELWCGDLVLKQTFQLLDQSGTYTAPPICFLVSSSNDFTRSPSVSQKMTNFSGQLSRNMVFTPICTSPHKTLYTQEPYRTEVFSEDIPCAVLCYNCGTKWPWGVSGIMFGFMYPT